MCIRLFHGTVLAISPIFHFFNHPRHSWNRHCRHCTVNSVHSDTERATESDRIDGLSVLSGLNFDIRALFPQGPKQKKNKLKKLEAVTEETVSKKLLTYHIFFTHGDINLQRKQCSRQSQTHSSIPPQGCRHLGSRLEYSREYGD